MKIINLLLIVLFISFVGLSLNAQSCHKTKTKGSCCSKKSLKSDITNDDLKIKEVVFEQGTERFEDSTFKVYGNCSMCKERIESVLSKEEGIQNSNWNVDTKLLDVKYDAEKISLQRIHELVAGVGHDTELKKASDDIYSGLQGCCQYDRQLIKNN